MVDGATTHTDQELDSDLEEDASPIQVCGNGVVEASEVCDDGSIEDNDCCAADQCKHQRQGRHIYPFANQACNVKLVYPRFGSVCRTSEGYPILTSTHYL